MRATNARCKPIRNCLGKMQAIETVHGRGARCRWKVQGRTAEKRTAKMHSLKLLATKLNRAYQRSPGLLAPHTIDGTCTKTKECVLGITNAREENVSCRVP